MVPNKKNSTLFEKIYSLKFLNIINGENNMDEKNTPKNEPKKLINIQIKLDKEIFYKNIKRFCFIILVIVVIKWSLNSNNSILEEFGNEKVIRMIILTYAFFIFLMNFLKSRKIEKIIEAIEN